jgi:predicted RNA-binding Zn ribbon-like protein
MAHKRQQAPGALEHVRSFVNTLDIETGDDALETPAALVGWLSERGLIEPGARATEADLRHARRLRESLRALLLANNGVEADPDAPRALEAAARRARLRVAFHEQGSEIEPQAGGVAGAIGRLLAIVHAAMHAGTWDRLKACPWETCEAAFYDNTKNRSGVWCTMEVCGNRAKARAYRQRRTQTG